MTTAWRFADMLRSVSFMGQEADERGKLYLCEFLFIFFHLYLKLIVFMCRLKTYADDSLASRSCVNFVILWGGKGLK